MEATIKGTVTNIENGFLGIIVTGKRRLLKWLPVKGEELYKHMRHTLKENENVEIKTITSYNSSLDKYETYIIGFTNFAK